MALYDATLARTPGLASRRSAPRTAAAVGALVLSVIGIACAVANYPELAEYARRSAEESSRPRYRAMRGLGVLPAAIVVLATTFGVFAVMALLGSATRVWVRAETGTPLRRRFTGFHALTPDAFDRLHAAFASGDSARYTPLPVQTRGGDGVVLIWTADTDREAYVGMTWGGRVGSTRNAPLIRLAGDRFDALERALRDRLTTPQGTAASAPPGTAPSPE